MAEEGILPFKPPNPVAELSEVVETDLNVAQLIATVISVLELVFLSSIESCKPIITYHRP